jgi:TPP-dependent pyruvate/acetoin dehydrogenase alpha subunit
VCRTRKGHKISICNQNYYCNYSNSIVYNNSKVSSDTMVMILLHLQAKAYGRSRPKEYIKEGSVPTLIRQATFRSVHHGAANDDQTPKSKKRKTTIERLERNARKEVIIH